MHLKLIPPQDTQAPDCLRDALCLPGAGRLFQRQLLEQTSRPKEKSSQLFVPSEWLSLLDKGSVKPQVVDREGLSVRLLNGDKDGLLISNARLECHCNLHKLNALLDPSRSEAVAIEAAPDLAAPTDVVRTISQNRLVGFRRLLEDIVEPAVVHGTTFPAFLYFPPAVCKRLGQDSRIPLTPERLDRYLADHAIPMRWYRLGGERCDLSTPEGVLHLLGRLPANQLNKVAATAAVHPTARIIGPVWIDDDVRIEENALVVGPSILCKGVHVGAGAVIRNVVMAPLLKAEPGESLQSILWLSPNSRQQVAACAAVSSEFAERTGVYRRWPLFSYVRLIKRFFDIVFSLFILLWVSLVFPVIVLLLKWNSPGPIFYRARRQGLHGQEFDCLKFRTMMTQADTLQERLRIVNQVDGPQFKITNDPRITGVGKFLRDTCIDELPQFINVLLGQMSVVGPRPSPENENESCPAWRDARLSVRPGITGLWQVCRTRQASMDFQEWVYYDTKYVRNLSFSQDFSICLKTASKLINTFLDQFG